MDLIILGDAIVGFKNAHEKAIRYNVRGKKINRIEKDAFKNCSYKFDFNIPKGVQVVENGAFDNAKFSVIRVPYSVKTLGESNFGNKIKLLNRYTKAGVFIGEKWKLDRLTCENGLPLIIQLLYVLMCTSLLLDFCVTKVFIAGWGSLFKALGILLLSSGVINVIKQLYLSWRWK